MIKSYLYMVTILTTTSIFCDTIHFTNSQNHLLNSTNHTVYHVNVPGSEPITIIEADKIDNDSDDDDDGDRKYVTSDRLVMASGNAANRRVGEISALSKKTVYSPELLEKFLQDYSHKVQSDQIEYNTEMEPNENSADAIQEKLEAIAKLTQQMTTEPNVPMDEHFYNNENEAENIEGGRDENNIQEKYAGHYDDRNKKYQHYSNHNSHEANRFNDRDGWVTLDAIPWSNSKVSKWHPNSNKVTHFAHVSPLQPQWADEPDSYERPRPRPPSSYEPFPPNPHDDDYYKPVRPSSNPDYYQPGYDTLKPPAYGHNDNEFAKPIDWNKYVDRDGRPNMYDYNRPKPNQGYYQSSPRPTSTSHSSDSWYNNKQPESYRPHWHDDVITDGHPSNFPQKPYESRPPRPSSAYQEEDRYVPNYHSTAASQHHPQTHPSTGNGEWVLISTTKGYHFPPKHGKRAMGFQTTNGSAEKTHTIQLTVLPAAASSTNQQFSAPTSTVPNQSAIEIVAADNRTPPPPPPSSSSPVPAIKTKPKLHNRKTVFKPLSSRNSGDSTAVLAAVGAGMVPATVAMLMPMVLGRKKRDAERQDHRISYTMSQ